MTVAKKIEQLTTKKVEKKSPKDIYRKFKQLDGSHPYKKVTPEGFVDYPARTRKGGKVRYFNFDLAKEMGLIPKDHPEEITEELKENILETFAIIIINEFDEENNKEFKPDEVKSGTYMATRYLQLQHPDKKGKNSGDGRSVWIGQIKNSGKVWDVSGCGTGATRLSPATSKFNKFFESGDPSISYGCGYAEVDEGMAQALFSEVFYKNQIKTERALVVLEFEKGYAINIRAHQNLLRPSHFFMHLKQNELEPLKSLLDYHIELKRSDESFAKCPQGKGKYKFFLKDFANTFGEIASTFENEYVFCWLDWDGDNILMDGSIIDYGSIRQFGLFHSEYRYDDVDRYSTSILEQREKARYIVQCFAQIVDYIENGEKQAISKFKKHWCIDQFDERFEEVKNTSILFKVGFSPKECAYLMKYDLKEIKEFRKVFSYFERAKSKKGMVKVPDGISWDAIFCMRDILRELPQMIIARKDQITDEEFISILKSNYATEEDLSITSYRSKMIKSFQTKYWRLIEKAAKHNKQPFEKQLLDVSMRSSVINKIERVTGDSISIIVEKIIKQKNKMNTGEIYNLIRDFAELQTYMPHETPKLQKETKGLVKQFFEIVKEHREGL